MSTTQRMPPPSNLDIEELVRKEYWRSLTTSKPVYGSDFDGTLTDETLQHLLTCQKKIKL